MGYKATSLGIMSGSSLDGLDLCLTEFSEEERNWNYDILATDTIAIPNDLTQRLRNSRNLGDEDLSLLDKEYGSFIAEKVNLLSKKANIVGFHGHTVLHSPEKKISTQIGNAQVVASEIEIPVVSNFRMKDILLGGQGAPLVPMGEKLLFQEYNSFLNLGGICNSSFKDSGKWIAGDIGPFNQVFNYYSNKLGHDFDKGGNLARSGNDLPKLIAKWESVPFFSESFPKSLGNDWVENEFFNHVENPIDVLCSFAHFISGRVGFQIEQVSPKQTLVTGGGTWNTFLIDLIQQKTCSELVIPDKQLVNYKEALIFGFLGVLRSRNLTNVLSSCTGASQDSSSGDIHLP